MNETGATTSRARQRLSAARQTTLPIAIIGAVAVSLAAPAPAHAEQHRPTSATAPQPAPRAAGPASAVAARATPVVAAVPSTHLVRSGETVSGIAGRYGLSTVSILSANGLGWSTLIHPGQTLVLPGSSAPAAVSATTPAATVATHTIAKGDTIEAIAERHGVRQQALLDANGLTWSSIIYPGSTLRIPSKTPAQSLVTLNSPQRENAGIIIDVGRQLGVSDYGIVIALATAMQESSMRNIDHGDRDSLGLFQQRPSQGWGTRAQIMDRWNAATLFYRGNVDAPGLLDIPGWSSMTLTRAAQAVQVSAHPDAYAKWEKSAWTWLADLG
jgi:LysM repeat protein